MHVFSVLRLFALQRDSIGCYSIFQIVLNESAMHSTHGKGGMPSFIDNKWNARNKVKRYELSERSDTSILSKRDRALRWIDLTWFR